MNVDGIRSVQEITCLYDVDNFHVYETLSLLKAKCLGRSFDKLHKLTFS